MVTGPEKRLDEQKKYWVGFTFGLYTVTDVVVDALYGSQRILCVCTCKCGTIRKFLPSIIRGRIKMGHRSCGCLAAKEQGERRRGKSPANKKATGEAAAKYLYNRYRQRARKKDKELTLTFEQFKELTKQDCYYCGSSPNSLSSGTCNYNGSYLYNGIDRINSSEGYTPQNSRPCCKTCNIAKNDLSEKKFYLWLKRIQGHLQYELLNTFEE